MSPEKQGQGAVLGTVEPLTELPALFPGVSPTAYPNHWSCRLSLRAEEW